MKRGWFYRQGDRMILHRQNAEDAPLEIGTVPQVTGRIVHLTDDGQDIRSEYLVLGRRQRVARILTEDELDKGTWAAKAGARRPTGADERHAFARLIREEGDAAPEIAARTYYTDDGDLVLPDADAQTLGYRTLRGSEEDARQNWEEIGAYASMDGRSALVMGAYFVGPVLDSLDMLAHMVSVHGPGQQGKSTILVVCAACYGDLKPRRQQLMTTWNSSKQGITQSLRQRGYLPMALDEHSSSGRTIKDSSREISQMVAGAIRAMGTADGSPRESDGFWHSVILSSSNEPLKHEGQTEDLASRLQEFKAPFFPNVMLDAEGAPAEPGHPGAEHVSKRLKRLAKASGGWPIEWAVGLGMFRAANLAQLKKLHLELCARYRPAQGGIAATIAELHMAWVVGAHMLGTAIGVPSLGAVAETEAAARLAEAIEIAAEANVPDHEALWAALDALRIEKSAFPTIDDLPAVAAEGMRRIRGFVNPENNQWWVINPVVRDAATQAGVDNVTAALQELDKLGVHLRGSGKHAQRLLPRAVRDHGLGTRMHCFSTDRAAELFAAEEVPADGPDEEFPSGTTPRNHPGTTGVVPENWPLTCGGTTGTTGTTLELFDFSKETGATPRNHSGATGTTESTDSRARDVTMYVSDVQPEGTYYGLTVPLERGFPPATVRVTDPQFAALEERATGRTRRALRFGVLGAGMLHLPNREPVRVVMPANVDQVPYLMERYELRTLWIHEQGALHMGLPAFEERRGDNPAEYRGCQAPVEHPWTTPPPGSPLIVRGGGLSCWLTIKPNGESDTGRDELRIALPMYDDRFDRADEPGRGGFGAAADPATLVDALMVFLLSTVHGPDDRPKVIPYYLSPNATAKDFAGGSERADVVVSEAIRNGTVPPARHNAVRPLVDMQWTRDPSTLSEDERSMKWLHQYDKNAAWLGGFSGAKLGVGDPDHFPDGRPYDKRLAGYWRVRDIPGKGLPGLPELRLYEAEDGGYWLRTPGMDLLIEIYPDWTPDIVEAWVWPTTSRALYAMYDKVLASRTFIMDAIDRNRPGAPLAKQVNGMLYQSFRGYLGRRDAQRDHQTGEMYAKDIWWRPDWGQMILDLALANTYRNLVKFSASGHYPLSLRVDAATYLSNHADPLASKPDPMTIGKSGRDWKPELSLPFAEILPLLDERPRMSYALKTYKESLQRSNEKGE
ncbi:DUF927 domain-containing protein [Streptomyces sp. NPDC087300]|uniref:DUF927 domain-containing protein n=1 Tax=Streptomyces sp. NPDC087300 TaxID=3365780 RepID=UPI0037FC8D9C